MSRARPDLVSSLEGPPVLLEWRFGSGGRGGAFIVDGERSVPLLCLTGDGAARAGSDCVHIDVPGLFRATFRLGSGGARLVYGHCALLGQWGIAGGRYEAVLPPAGRSV
jgi:hypothetical protein